MSTLRNSALAFLRVVNDEKHVAHKAIRDFAVDALRVTAPDSTPWRRAIEVLEGGPLRLRRAVDLAALVLGGSSPEPFPEEPAAPGDIGARFPEAEEEIRAMKEDGDFAPSRQPVTTITVRWQGNPAALDAALTYARDEIACAKVYTDNDRTQRGLVLTVLDVLVGVEIVGGAALPDGLGVSRATTNAEVSDAAP